MRLRKLTRRALPSAIHECMSVQDMVRRHDKHTFVNADQNVPIRAQSDCGNIFAVLERKSKGFVAAHEYGQSAARADYRRQQPTDLTKSKTETLFPTGLSTELPSDVNMMFP